MMSCPRREPHCPILNLMLQDGSVLDCIAFHPPGAHEQLLARARELVNEHAVWRAGQR